MDAPRHNLEDRIKALDAIHGGQGRRPSGHFTIWESIKLFFLGHF